MFPGSLLLFCDATSLGGVESLIEWRRKVRIEAHTHTSLRQIVQYDASVPGGLCRVSIGLEDVDDLIKDMEKGLKSLP